MKKLFTFLIGLMLFAPLFGQKDVVINLLSPETGADIYDDETFPLTFSIKNVGIDTIAASDSFFVFMKVDGDKVMGLFYNLNIPHTAIAPGDSTFKTYSFGFKSGQLDPFSFCFELETSNNGIRVDSNLTNNESCATIEVKLRGTTGIQKVNTTNIKIYPNPASSTIIFESMDNEAAKAIITDAAGREVAVVDLETGINNLQVNSLANGIYVCKLINSQGSLVTMQKIVVSH